MRKKFGLFGVPPTFDMDFGKNKENNVFKDAIGVKGLRFKLHGNNYGKQYGNYHDTHRTRCFNRGRSRSQEPIMGGVSNT